MSEAQVLEGHAEASTTGIAIDIVGVEKVFGDGSDRVVALDKVSISIRENEFFTLLGPSGCGKTTLLRLIAGFEHPTSGQIFLHRNEISQLPPYQRPVNTVFQNYALFPHMTVAENIGFALEMLEKPKAEIKSTVDDMLRLVKMETMRDRKTDQISGGQQQRVALARALAPHPKVLLLDEPLSALDYKLRKEMQIELKRLQNETGITFVFVTHDQEEALTMSDRVAVMNQGNILQAGPPHEIYDHPVERFVADFIGDTNFLRAEIISRENASAMIQLAAGNELTVSLPDGGPTAGEVTVAIRPEQVNLTKDKGTAELQGVLKEIVYFGTDTHYHIELSSGEPFIARVQNDRGRQHSYDIGSQVGINFEADVIQVLKD